MKILITGGAGYIGSHTLVEVLKAGPGRHQPVANTVQPHPSASDPEYASASTGNSSQEWHGTWGLDILLIH